MGLVGATVLWYSAINLSYTSSAGVDQRRNRENSLDAVSCVFDGRARLFSFQNAALQMRLLHGLWCLLLFKVSVSTHMILTVCPSSLLRLRLLYYAKTFSK